MMFTELTAFHVRQHIYCIRDQRVILDEELAKFFEITTKKLNQHVKRKVYKFPEDFRFQLTQLEYHALLKSLDLPISDHGGRRHLPYAFTKPGVITLASELNTEQATNTLKILIRAFVDVKKNPSPPRNLTAELASIKNQNDRIMKILTDHFIQSRSKPETNTPQTATPQGSAAQYTPPQNPSYKPTSPTFTGPTKDLDQIVHAVATYYRLKPQDLKLRRRTNNVVIPRQIAMYLIRKRTGTGFVEIGNYFGKKDHTTVIHAIKKIEVQLKENSKVSEAIREIEALFQR